MKALALTALFCSCLGAQNLAFYLDPSGGGSPVSALTSLPAAYGFPDTPVGSVSSTVIRVVNTGPASVVVDAVYVGAEAGSAYRTPNFTLTGSTLGATIAPGAFKLMTFNFTPSTTGITFGYLQASVAGVSIPMTTAAGNGTAPQITLSCSSSGVVQCTGATLQPNSANSLTFPNTLTTSSTQVPFTLTNSSASAINPQTLVSLTVTTNNPNSPFSLSSLPSTLAPGSSLTFNVTFAPSTANTYQTNLLVGNATYPLIGSGSSSVLGDISSLVITYVDSTGVRLTAQPATPISLGQSVVGGSGSNSFTFSITNPQTTISAVSVSALSVSGTGFAISQAPLLPFSVAPGTSTTFTVTFNATGTGTFSGLLTVGTRVFSLTGQGITSPLPNPSFSLDVQPLVSQKQLICPLTFRRLLRSAPSAPSP